MNSCQASPGKGDQNTVRFGEELNGPIVVGTLYVQKWAVKQLGEPEKLEVVIRTGK